MIKDFATGFLKLSLKTQIFEKIKETKSPPKYPKREAIIKFSKIKNIEV